MYARKNAIRIYYETHGSPDKPPILLVRGLARSSRHWLDFGARLAKDFYVILFDNRGVGRTSTPLPPYTTGDMADDGVAVLDALGIERSHVFGQSLGGMISQEIALRHPHRVRGLVLGCTRGGGRLNTKGPSLSTSWRLVNAIRFPPPEAMRHTARIVISERFYNTNPEVVDAWAAIEEIEPARRRGMVGQFFAAMRHNASQRLPNIQTPTMVMTGDADLLIPAENSLALAKAIPGAELVMIPGAGHDFCAEAPELVCKELGRFLSPL
jgi:3-oxoadipate enol-lactonase